jgi:hypothetical protein
MVKNKTERGQSLVVIAIAFLGLIAVAALIIDGGSLYLNRRNAQTAADAAALAGAHEMCVEKGDNTAIQNIVNLYAVTENGATIVESLTIDRTNKTIAVQTRIDTPSFFASMLGRETNTVRADATANCFSPSKGSSLLPVAWSCQPPVGGSPDECSIHAIPWKLFRDEIYPRFKINLGEGGSLLLDEGDGATYQSYVDGLPINVATGRPKTMPYVVMEDNTFNITQCAPPIGAGTLVCDFNNDGILDLTGGGDRGWLAMDGSNGASSLIDILVSGYPNPVTLPQWFPSDLGAKASAFGKSKGLLEGKVALVPVYNAYCLSTTAEGIPTKCPTSYKAGDLVTSGPGTPTYVRVTGFAPFVVTCISSKPGEKCPAKTVAKLDHNTRTFEGYFVSGYIGGLEIEPGGFELGIYIISLTK